MLLLTFEDLLLANGNSEELLATPLRHTAGKQFVEEFLKSSHT